MWNVIALGGQIAKICLSNRRQIIKMQDSLHGHGNLTRINDVIKYNTIMTTG